MHREKFLVQGVGTKIPNQSAGHVRLTLQPEELRGGTKDPTPLTASPHTHIYVYTHRTVLVSQYTIAPIIDIIYDSTSTLERRCDRSSVWIRRGKYGMGTPTGKRIKTPELFYWPPGNWNAPQATRRRGK